MGEYIFEGLTSHFFENGYELMFQVRQIKKPDREGYSFELRVGASLPNLSRRFVVFIASEAIPELLIKIGNVPLSKVIFKLRKKLEPRKDSESLIEIGTAQLTVFDSPNLNPFVVGKELANILQEVDFISPATRVRISYVDNTLEHNIHEIKRRLLYFDERGWIIVGERGGALIQLTEKGRTEMLKFFDESQLTSPSQKTPIDSIVEKEYDIFICYPSEIEKDIARPLVHSLEKEQLKVWWDKNKIKWGDNFLQFIQAALVKTLFAIVVVSKDTAGKYYQRHEIDSLINFEATEREKRTLPLLHNVTIKELRRDFPFLANKSVLTTESSFSEIAKEAKKLVDTRNRSTDAK